VVLAFVFDRDHHARDDPSGEAGSLEDEAPWFGWLVDHDGREDLLTLEIAGFAYGQLTHHGRHGHSGYGLEQDLDTHRVVTVLRGAEQQARVPDRVRPHLDRPLKLDRFVHSTPL
jgi:hypothetical protein